MTQVKKSPANLLEAVVASLEAALRSADGVAPPVAVLWTDADGQWRPLIPILRDALPQLYTLGSYHPATRTGPVIWLKCIVDRTLPDVSPPEGEVPILYLPGVDRQQLRAAGDCPEALQPLVELQYRGTVWHQRNGRDWSVEAFLTSEYGLGLDVAADRATREAVQRALPLLAITPLAELQGRRLEAEDFDRLAIGDPVRDLLSWMSDSEGFRARCDTARWETFRNVCMREFDFDPEQGGPEAAGELLMHGGGRWDEVWQRFREAPRAYRGVSALLRRPAKDLLVPRERQPNVSSQQEAALRSELEAVTQLPHHQACDRLVALEQEHGERRGWVWAELGESPLAMALEPLARLARLARSPLGGATIEAVIEAYVTDGWRCDRASLEALSLALSTSETTLITRVLRALYEPWLDKSARHFQSLAGDDGVELRKLCNGVQAEPETCILFADGLRFDVGGMLQERLEARGLRVKLGYRVAPLPTVTPTAKPFASPVHGALSGEISAEDFTPFFSATGQRASVERLREQLRSTGVAVLSADDLRAPAGNENGGWLEFGQLDQLGHSLGTRLASQIEAQVETIADRVVALLEAGWLRVKVVTDHGWLLLPGNLPKVELPHYLVATRWARCASVKGDSSVSVPVYPWHWNAQVRIASPPGIASFVAGTEYAHGGVSPQECIVPELVVERGTERLWAEIQSVQWRGMRCRVSVATNASGARVDIRLNWKQPGSSIVASIKEVGAGGDASLAVADDRHEGSAATVVVLDASDNVLARKATTVGEAL